MSPPPVENITGCCAAYMQSVLPSKNMSFQQMFLFQVTKTSCAHLKHDCFQHVLIPELSNFSSLVSGHKLQNMTLYLPLQCQFWNMNGPAVK